MLQGQHNLDQAGDAAAAEAWPILDLTEPIAQNPARPVWRRNASVSAATSTGSPSGVPVPWASTSEMVAGDDASRS